jgi:hypothetical protein
MRTTQPRPPPTKFLEIPFTSPKNPLPLVELSPGVFILDAFESYWDLFTALDSWVIEHQDLDHTTYENFITTTIKPSQSPPQPLPSVSEQTYSTINLSAKDDPPSHSPISSNLPTTNHPSESNTLTVRFKRNLNTNTNSSPRLVQSYLLSKTLK